MFSFYVDPKQVDPSHVFDADMTRYLDWFQRAKAIPGKAVMTPGEPERGRARKTHRERRAAAERGLGVDRRGGAERRGEPGPLVLSRSFDPPICVQTSDAAKSRVPDSTH